MPTVPVAVRAQFDALVRRGVFRPCERFVCQAHDAEDRIAEGLARTWQWYQQQFALGRNPDLALVVYVCRLRMVDRSHRLDSGDHRHWRLDVFERQGRGGVELRRLQLHELDDDRVEEDLGLAEAGAQDPTPKLDSALDLQDWLAELGAEDRTVLQLRASGHTLTEIGREVRQTTSTVYRRCRDLGHELALRAEVEVEPRRHRRPRPEPPAEAAL
jgi:DNA-directed RNA polymerase specialized sigma24 family protein